MNCIESPNCDTSIIERACCVRPPVEMSEAAVEAKSQGGISWSSGNYAEAAQHFTTALEIGGDKDFMQVLIERDGEIER
jgi:hypothetical protein